MLLCIRRRSTSATAQVSGRPCMPQQSASTIPLLTTNALWPLGIMWRVFLLEPYPICEAFRQPLSSQTFPFSPSKKNFLCESRGHGSRTLGMAARPLNRLRTALSIPLGLRHDGSTPTHCQILFPQLPFPKSCLLHLKRSDWWRLKRLVSAKRNTSVAKFRPHRGQRCRRTLLDDRDVLLSGDHLTESQ